MSKAAVPRERSRRLSRRRWFYPWLSFLWPPYSAHAGQDLCGWKRRV